MRTILLSASYYAKITNFDFTFDLKDVQEVLKGILIKDPYEREIIYSVFEYKHDQFEKSMFSESEIEDGMISCTGDVMHKITLLKEHGIDIFNDEGYSFFKKELPEDYKHEDSEKRTIPKNNTLKGDLVSQNDLNDIAEAPTGFARLYAIKRLKKILNTKVLNQEVAVEAVCDALVKAEHIQSKSRPKGIFFFLGPPATGKTYLAEILKENLSGYETGFVYDMTQFTHENSGGQLYGTSRMWGNTKVGSLTSFVRKNPRSIIVFDEFEKAYNTVQSNLLSILSGGFLNDVCGWCTDDKPWTDDRKTNSECEEESLETRVDFSQTIVIFTSNLGKEIYSNQELMRHVKDDPIQIEGMVYDAISREEKTQDGHMVPAITPEMLSRLRQGSMVLFNKLHYRELRTIAEKTLELEQKAFEKNYNVKINFAEEVLDTMLLGFGPSFDIRGIKAMIGKKVFDAITDHFMEHGTVFKRFSVKLDTTAKKALSEIMSDPEKLIREFKHKNRRLRFTRTVKEGKATLQIIFSDLSITTIKKAKDFGDDGVTLEMPETAFTDIAGHTFVKSQLQEIVGLLKDAKTLQALGTKLSKGMLLYGLPGTGKTMLAKALANEADLPFISTTGQELLQDGKISKLFSTAREYAPAIVFIDEIDAIPKRGVDPYSDTIVNQLLTQIDGFSTSYEEPIFVVAATNRMDKIDPAILRSGRVDIHIEVAALDRDARGYFINKMLENPIFDAKIDKEQIIKFTANLNGSDLEKIERESILFVYRKGLKKVTHEVLLEQVNTIKHGHKIENKNLQSVLDATAYHEAGHAVLSKVLLPFKRIEQVTVMPRNKSLGFVSFSESDEYYSHNIDYVKHEICVNLAGRIAQSKQFGNHGIDSGASSDLDTANRLAYIAITRYGMDERLKNLSVSILDDESMYKNEIIFERMQVWMSEATERTEALVNEHWSAIESLAKHLIEAEQIDEKTLDKIIKGK